MQFRGLIVAAALLLILSGGIWWSNKTKKEEADKPTKETGPKIITTLESDVQEIELRRKDGEVTIVKRTADGWEITEPEKLRGDNAAIQKVASLLGGMSAEQVIEEKPTELGQFGLADPRLTVVVHRKDGRTVKLLVGNEVPTGEGRFARVDGDPKVYTLSGFVSSGVDKYAKDLRDTRLLLIDSERLARVDLTAKNATTEFVRSPKREWQIVKPQPLRADGWQVEELIRRLIELKMNPTQSLPDAKKAETAFGSAAVVAKTALTDNASTQTLELRRTKDGQYYAKSASVPGVYPVPKDTGDFLDKSTTDFRNKKLFDFSFSDPSRVDYKDPSRPLSLMKAGEKWMAGGKEMDSVSVQSLIDKLRDISAVSFPEAGFTTPVIELAVFSNEGKTKEKVLVSKSALGRYIAQRENEPALYELDPKVVEDLQQTASAVKEPVPAKKK